MYIYVSHKSHALKQIIITICCGIFYMTLHVMPSENFGLWSSLRICFKINKCFLTEFLNILILLSLWSIELWITLSLQGRIKARLNIIDEIATMFVVVNGNFIAQAWISDMADWVMFLREKFSFFKWGPWAINSRGEILKGVTKGFAVLLLLRRKIVSRQIHHSL